MGEAYTNILESYLLAQISGLVILIWEDALSYTSVLILAFLPYL